MLKSEGNFYEPSYFSIKLDTLETLSQIVGTPNESIFVHEYVHLLQDISLTSTRCLMWQNVNEYRNIADEIRTKGNCARPIRISSVSGVVNEKIFDSIWGESVFYDRATIAKLEVKDERIHTDVVRKAMVLTLDTDEGPRTYRVGMRDFCETMAAAIQEHIYGSQSLPDIPYRTVQLILKHQGRPQDPYLVSMICELALSSFDPLAGFLMYLDRGADKSTPSDLRESMYGSMALQYHDGTILTKTESDAKNFAESKAMILDWFKAPIFRDLHIWIEKLLDTGDSIRKADAVYLSKLLTVDPENARRQIWEHVYKTGVPIVYNNAYICQTIGGRDAQVNTAFLLALKELHEFLTSSQKACNLVQLCKTAELMASSMNVDELCNSNVVKKVDQEMLCPVAAWIKTFGLQAVQ